MQFETCKNLAMVNDGLKLTNLKLVLDTKVFVFILALDTKASVLILLLGMKVLLLYS